MIAEADTTAPVPSSDAKPATVECVDVAKTYDNGRVRAVDGVSFTAPPGAITAIVGPSGCGKTTLLRCIAGLDDPGAGTIRIGGTDVTGRDPRDRGIGMVFQNAGLYPDKTVAANIGFPLRMAGVGRVNRDRRIHDVAALVRLTDLLGRLPRELSGGQRQRVGLARALVRHPRVVLLDEPLSSLDAALRTDLRRDLRELQQRLGLTMIFVTHDQTEAMTLGDQLVVLFDGRLAQAGTALEVFHRPARVDVARFLGAMNTLTTEAFAAAARSGINGLRTDRTRATIGFRPEDATITGIDARPGPDAIAVRGRPDYGELHGSDALLSVRVGADRLHVRVPAAEMNEHLRRPTVTISVPLRALHWFDHTGRRQPAAGHDVRDEAGIGR